MSDWQLVHDSIRDSDIAGAITTLETFIANHDSQRFSCLLRESFSNSPSTVLADVNRFIRANDKQFDVKAVYLEMNGFEINMMSGSSIPLPTAAIHRISMIRNG
jgi:hypothetical protein